MRPVILLLFSVFSIAAFAQNSIQFHESGWKAILAQAKAENKLIFMDAYASWCGPCKMMAKNVFTDEAVIDYYEASFVNAKIDMEKGEGPELAEMYSVRAYPTLLFINGNGELVHRAVGYHAAEQFIELGKTANDPSLQLSSLTKRYVNGERDPEFLRTYANAAMNAMDPKADQIAEAYLATQSDWNTEENMQMILQTVSSTDSKMYDYLIENRAAFESYFGKEYVIGTVQNLIISSLADKGSDDAILSEVKKLYQEAYPEYADELYANFSMEFYLQAGNTAAFAEAAVAYVEAAEEDPYTYNNIAWTFYESVEDPAMLKKAIGWAEKSVKLMDAYFNNDTLAWLNYKAGKKGKAKKAAQKAIALAKQNGEDYSATQELLDML
ncbi:MAG TPA: thioredoxin family protein [Saprospiraceae bacterium]|nr:thioredoxin family protein [Saprospiraceae bacterium]HMQ83947.1 thioredoxin family protein [Saprospiraceae bacterium]